MDYKENKSLYSNMPSFFDDGGPTFEDLSKTCVADTTTCFDNIIKRKMEQINADELEFQ